MRVLGYRLLGPAYLAAPLRTRRYNADEGKKRCRWNRYGRLCSTSATIPTTTTAKQPIRNADGFSSLQSNRRLAIDARHFGRVCAATSEASPTFPEMTICGREVLPVTEANLAGPVRR